MIQPPNDEGHEPDDPDAAHFAQVTSGIYRRVIPETVWLAFCFAIRNQLPQENPTILMMFVRIAEVYPEVREYLSNKLAEAEPKHKSALTLVLNPPAELHDAKYLPESIGSPGEMDLCWSEFLVTGSVEPILKVVAVLDREDMSRELINGWLSDEEDSVLKLDEEEMQTLASAGIALGKAYGPWKIMSPGDIDVLIWFGVKDQNPICIRIFQELNEEQLLHMANKGAAFWSLHANANQHGKIRLLCEEQAKLPGGAARLLIDPSTA